MTSPSTDAEIRMFSLDGSYSISMRAIVITAVVVLCPMSRTLGVSCEQSMPLLC